ncbi:MAG: Rpn family recombination-promoting nuclease/putative transposase [Candidatus Sericytochromatia bacterium]
MVKSKGIEKKLVRFDWAIKNILRDKANFVILEGFLSELLKQDVKIIELLESESNKERKVEKLNRVDLLVKLNKNEIVIIEIQNDDEYDYFQRILYGVSKSISENLEQGKKYKAVKKVISISIVYFELGLGSDYIYHGTTNFVGIHKKDKLELTLEQKALFKKEELSEIFPEYYILMVDKFDENTKDGLDEWIYFLKTDKVKEEFKGKGLKEAFTQLDVLKMNEKEKRGYDYYLADLSLRASLADTQKFKLEQAEEQGIKKGKIEGKIERDIEIIISGNKEGASNDFLSKITGLSIKEVEKIIKEYQPRHEEKKKTGKKSK